MNKKQIEKVFVINPEKAPIGLRNLFSRRLVEHMVGLPKLDRIVADARALISSNEGMNFNDALLDGMGVKTEVLEEDLAKIPKTGPVIVVANHPFGGLEGVVFLKILGMVRPDFKVMANYVLSAVPEMRQNFIFVDPFGSAEAKSANRRPLMDTIRWLKDGHILGAFPAGEVSSVDLKSRIVRDPPWSTTIAAIARKTGATIVPMHFMGRNPRFFQCAGVVHPRLRTVLLPRMMSRLRGHSVTAFIGTPITPSEIAKIPDDKELTKYMRLRSYSLEGRADPKKRTVFPRFLKRKAASSPQMEVIGETPTEAIEAEIARFPEEAFLLSGSGLKVYITRLGADSAILRELGRLREITFRSVGEGTGRETDTDVFDPYYHHLFLWHETDRKIVGAYRLGLTPEIMAKFGVEGLYTHTLFRYNAKLIKQIQPCIEMGRSFVRPEYQRAFAPLLMLWKGIGTFIGRHPEYTTLFGSVSITAAYRDSSRNMLLRSLRLSNFSNELTRLVKPRNPPRKGRKAEWKNPCYDDLLSDTDLVGNLIADIEKDHKSIPVLIRQYIRLGGQILAFNVDADFSDVVDGLIMVDLRKTEARARAHYMGTEANKQFCAYHNLPL